MKPLPGEHEEAKRHPNGYVYRIDGQFRPHEAVLPDRIIGAWAVDETGKITGGFLPSPNYQPSAAKIRKAGFRKLVLGAMIFGASIVAFYQLSARNLMPNDPHLLMLAGFPFAYFGVGVIECITGAPFQQLANGWMALRGWQRGAIGTFLILLSMVIILCLGALVLGIFL